MTLVQEQIPNLINGISQQPPSQRLASQGQLQKNMIVDKAEGLKKRPPTEHVSKISGRTDIQSYGHTINRDDTEQF